MLYLKTSSSKAAISMIMENPENEILLLQDILPCFCCYCFISEKMCPKMHLLINKY